MHKQLKESPTSLVKEVGKARSGWAAPKTLNAVAPVAKVVKRYGSD